MYSFYDPYIKKENEYYCSLEPGEPADGNINPKMLNDAVDWLSQGTKSVLDFGCGSGGFLFCCAFRGVKELTGIDLAEAGVDFAKKCSTFFSDSEFHLIHGSIERLRELPETCFDGLILSNVLDNMRPKDAVTALEECVRSLKPGGKAIIKLNSYLTPDKIREWNVKVLDGDLLDDGMLLWNQMDEVWFERLCCYFTEVNQEDVFYEEYEMHNRLFLCVK